MLTSVGEEYYQKLGRIKPQRGGEFIWKKGRGFVPMYSKRKILWMRFTDWLRYKRTGSYFHKNIDMSRFMKVETVKLDWTWEE